MGSTPKPDPMDGVPIPRADRSMCMDAHVLDPEIADPDDAVDILETMARQDARYGDKESGGVSWGIAA